MKKIVSLALISALLLALFTGCTTTEKQQTSGGQNAESTAKPENIRTDIVIANTADVSSTDPHDQTDVYSAAVCDMMYSKLFYFDEEVNLTPGLAKEWEIVSDTEYVLHLEEGVKWHNGDELKAGDVKFSIERMIREPKTSALYTAIDSVEVVDDYTVRFTTSVPTASILLNLAGPQACIVNEKVVTEAENSGKKYGDVTPVGTGPMKFDSWRVNDSFKVVRFDDYYKGPVVASSITTKVIPEPSTRTIALETGDVDFIGAVPSIDTEKILANKELKTEEVLGTSLSYMGINVQKAPFDNKLVRQAIEHAINKQNIIDVVLEGYGIPVNSVFQTMMPSHDSELNLYPHDIAKAKELMAQAGYPDGGLTMEIGVSSNTSDRAAALVQADLAQIGITVDIRMQEFGAFLQYLNGKDHNAFILGWSNCYNPDRTMSLMFHSDSPPASGNRCWYANEEVDKLIEQANTEMDWEKREPIYKELQRIIMEDAVWVPLYQTKSYMGMRANLMDAKISTLTPFHDFTNAYVVLD